MRQLIHIGFCYTLYGFFFSRHKELVGVLKEAMKENQAIQRDLQRFLGQVYLAESCPPKIHVHEEPMKAILFGNRALADVISC